MTAKWNQLEFTAKNELQEPASAAPLTTKSRTTSSLRRQRRLTVIFYGYQPSITFPLGFFDVYRQIQKDGIDTEAKMEMD